MTDRRRRPEFVPRGLSRLEAAAYVGLSPNAFDKAVAAGDLPPPRRFPSVAKALWDRRALDRVFDGSPEAPLSYTVDGEEAMLRAIEDAASRHAPRQGPPERRRPR